MEKEQTEEFVDISVSIPKKAKAGMDLVIAKSKNSDGRYKSIRQFVSISIEKNLEREKALLG